MASFDKFPDSLYLSEASFLSSLQERLSPLSDFVIPISSIGDPSKGFIIYFPLILAINYLKGIKFLGAFIVSEWINMNAKWILQGERPYWWIKEHQTNITLLQTPLTCETGPGVPSGHSQAAAVILWCLTDCLRAAGRPGLSLGLWLVFTAGQVLMWTSRLYISAHFPHQCLMGFVVGLLAVRIFYRRASWVQWRWVSLVLAALGLVSSSLALYSGLESLDRDPAWSLRLAQKHCQNRDWIYIDTTPFYTMARFTGAALGLALSGFLTMDVFKSPSLRTKIVAGVVGLLLGQLSHSLHSLIPRQPLSTFYTMEAGLNTLYVILVVKSYQLLFYHNFCGNQRANKKKDSQK